MNTVKKQMTNKIPLLFGVGTPHSATTPLLYTLSHDNHYCHSWRAQQHGYLTFMQGRNNQESALKRYHHNLDNPSNAKLPTLVSNNPLLGTVDIQSEKDFMSPPFTIEKYISYHQKQYNNIKPHYHSVVDFNNSNASLQLPFLQHIKPSLDHYFDIKVIMIFRDPIKRLWSHINYLINDLQAFELSSQREGFNRRGAWMSDLDRTPKKYFKDTTDALLTKGIDEHTAYAKLFKTWSTAFPERVHAIIMEDLWNPSTSSLQDLSDFLEFPLHTLHQNAYYPDKGINAPKYPYLQDQWSSDTDPLTLDIINKAKHILAPVYQDWKETFGDLPTSWIHP